MMFKQIMDMAGNIVSTHIKYTDPATGQVWDIPEGHRLWVELYEPWLAAGNTPTPPATS
jgi:hypothetical protein